MMRHVFTILFAVIVLSAILIAGIYLRMPPKTPEIHGVINYKTNIAYAMPPGKLDYTAQGRDFFDTLRQYQGQMIHLELELIESGEKGFTFQDAMGKKLKCDMDNNGIIDHYGLSPNIRKDIKIQFHHPEHFHAPTTMIIGDKRDFATQSMICDAYNFETDSDTRLVISGHFMVTIGSIPTALEYQLTPVRIEPKPLPRRIF